MNVQSDLGEFMLKCVACKNAGAWAYIIPILLGLQGSIEKSLLYIHAQQCKEATKKVSAVLNEE